MIWRMAERFRSLITFLALASVLRITNGDDAATTLKAFSSVSSDVDESNYANPPTESTMNALQSSALPNTPSHRCPGPYNPAYPWQQDLEDCSCYYVCDVSGGAVRMCCPGGLWWDVASRTCLYVSHFSEVSKEKCRSLAKGVGTTPQLKEIFVGRCWEYQRYISPGSFPDGYIDCEQLFDSFAEVFINQPACDYVKADDYSELVRQATTHLPANKQIFWSGVYSLAQEYSSHGKRGFTLESTLIGYTLNDVTWCGQSEAPGINFDGCPAFASCNDHVMASFWAKALESFALQAEGVVTVILNGSRTDGPVFKNNSFLAEHELPNLRPDHVTTVRVWVVHGLGHFDGNACVSDASLADMKTIVEQSGIHFQCEDDPIPLLHLLCLDTPYHPQCGLKYPKYAE